MWVRAVWQEGKRQEEGVVPDAWIEENTVRWPSGMNVKKPYLEKHIPREEWHTFPLIKVKCTSG